MRDAIVVGGGISGIACAAALAAEGVPVRVIDRGRGIGGRMASMTLRNTGSTFDGRVVDIGASYFTVADGDFRAVVDGLELAGVARPWTDTFHVADPQGIHGVKTGPMRYAAPRGLRSVVAALAAASPMVEVVQGHEVRRVAPVDDQVVVDGEVTGAAALCMPDPQARRLVDGLPPTAITWEPVIVVTCVFERRTWLDLDGVFVNDDPIVTWIADDGSRRGDGAPVLVAHVTPVLAALHLHNPGAAIRPVIATVRRVLGIDDHPVWVDCHRWTYAKPLSGSDDPYWLSGEAAIGLAGDAWSGGPRVEAAWLSGHRLGRAITDRVGAGT